MVPTGGRKSMERWPFSFPFWQICLLYIAFFCGCIFLPRVVENDNASNIETILEQAMLHDPNLVENVTVAPATPLYVPEHKASDILKKDILNQDTKVVEDKVVHEQKAQMETKLVEPKVPEPIASVPPPPEVKKPQDLNEESNATSHDDIPSFSEWAKKQMAEAGKTKGENLTVGTMKLRGKNYASPACGAKVVAANPEALSAGAILSPSRDDYMLNPCNVKIWFVVELCESIQPQRVDIANFELFSSSPQDLSIWVSDTYPTRDWIQVALVQAKDERTVQTFSLPPLSTFVKYVKVELHSHYGSEHYCPISLFKAYGISEMEILDHDDVEEEAAAKGGSSEDHEDTVYRLDEDGKEERDLFATVKASVMSVVKKAAEVLVVKGGTRNNTCPNITLSNDCFTPGYSVLCSNCSEEFYFRLFDVMCCHGEKLKRLLTNPFIYTVMVNSTICSEFGFNWNNLTTSNTTSADNAISVSYLKAFFNNETIAALCNYIAVTKKKTPLNVSEDKLPDAPLVEPSVDEPELQTPEVDPQNTNASGELPPIQPTKTLPEENNTSPEVNTNQTLSTDNDAHLDNSTTKIDKINSTQPTEPTPPLETDQLSKSEERKNDSLVVDNAIPPEVVQPAPSQDDPVSVDSLALDSLFPELEEEHTQDTETATTKTLNLKVQKESVFVRLANRIKALEVNMSLSGQYLEELSRRYKKQVEELQRSLANVMEERRLAVERENVQAAQLLTLTAKVEILTASVDQLLEDGNRWGQKAYYFGHHGVIIALEVIVLFMVVGLCRWFSSNHGKSFESELSKKSGNIQRRHSLEQSVVMTKSPPPKQRRPSEEAFIPSSSTHQELMIDCEKRKISRDHMKRRKKKRREKSEDGDSIVTIGSAGEELQTPPEFLRTAVWARQQRASAQTQTSSSQETLSSLVLQPPAPASLNNSIKKKTGAFKKIVRKIF